MPKMIAKPKDTPMHRHMVEGHLRRLGHPLDAVLVSDNGEIWQMIRPCCGDEIPE